LAYLNKDAALAAVPMVADIMTKELGWTADVKAEQIAAATKYVNSYGGRIPDNKERTLREGSYKNIEELFNAIDTDGSGFLDRTEVGELAYVLDITLSNEELTAAFNQMDQNGNDRVDLQEFEAWFNTSNDCAFYQKLSQELSLEKLKTMGGGTLLG
jgi:glycerol-3-phosphate dehydrogenase